MAPESKSDDNTKRPAPAPAGRELSERELNGIAGGVKSEPGPPDKGGKKP